MLDDKTKKRIRQEADFKADDGMAHRSPMKAYIAGAEAEAELSSGLVDFLHKIYKHKETWLNVRQWEELEQVLTNYNNSK